MKSVKKYAKAMGVAAVTFGVMDAIWIGGVARKIFESKIPHLMASSVNPVPAGLFYVGYIAGTVHLAVKPLDKDRSVSESARKGALLGALAYGTWGLTGASVLKDFPTSVALSDLLWGAVLTASTAASSRRLT